MTDLPRISIGLVTYKRTKEALETIRSTCENLAYPKELRSWYVGDDGSPGEHVDALLDGLRTRGENILGSFSEKLVPGTHFCGKGWNKTLGICHQNSDFVLWLEDDWQLDEKLDLIPYVRLLQEREDVGLVSFRILSVGADVHTLGHGGLVYLQYARTTQYAFSGNPYLRHARYTKRYGWFREDCNPGNLELKQDDEYRLAVDGPRIWRPAHISIWGAWKHIGTEKSWS